MQISSPLCIFLIVAKTTTFLVFYSILLVGDPTTVNEMFTCHGVSFVSPAVSMSAKSDVL